MTTTQSAPTCRICGGKIETPGRDGLHMCLGCYICRAYVTPAYQLAERYVLVCPDCGGRWKVDEHGQWHCSQCGLMQTVTTRQHYNDTRCPPLGVEFLDRHVPRLSDLARR